MNVLNLNKNYKTWQYSSTEYVLSKDKCSFVPILYSKMGDSLVQSKYSL